MDQGPCWFPVRLVRGTLLGHRGMVSSSSSMIPVGPSGLGCSQMAPGWPLAMTEVLISSLVTSGKLFPFSSLGFLIYRNLGKRSWLVWLSGLSACLQTKGSLVQFLVRAQAWVVGQVPSRGCMRSNYTLMFLSRYFSIPSPLCIHTYIHT